MPGFDVSTLTDEQRPTGVWAASVLHAIARDEAAGRRPPRLTEPKLDTWSRFRGRLSSADLVELLFEDGAVIHPIPFDPSAVGAPLHPGRLNEGLVDAWLKNVGALSLAGAGADYVGDQARMLGLPTRLARSELHVVKPHQRVLELPGTGGQLAYHLVTEQRDLTFHENFVIACATWQEVTLAGVIGLELGVPHSNFVWRTEVEDLKQADHPLRQRTFDFVVGIHPDKGGLFRVEDQLAIWFPGAKILLV
jgi:hypothetical protein